MKEQINAKLDEIEKKENVRILHCVESGSRAWGFASPDSDYDVRFIYVREKEFYLRLDKTRDVIEWQLDETLDISGWDLKKALVLLRKSNPTLFEWNASPIVYRTTQVWNEFSAEMNGFFDKKSALYHYLSIAKKNYRRYFQEENVQVKKYFYVLRPLLACRWIIEEGTPPPLPFRTLTDRYLEGTIKNGVDEMLSIKINVPETGKIGRFESVDRYIEQAIETTDKILTEIPANKPQSWDKLNKKFLSILQ